MSAGPDRERARVDRRTFLRVGAAAGAFAAAVGSSETANAQATGGTEGSVVPVAPLSIPPFELEETTIADLQKGMQEGRLTARSIAELYLARIDLVDKNGPGLNSVIEVNPDALGIAGQLDAERKSKGPRGPLHGIPVLIKDNIDTADGMLTTAGSLALAASKPARDSFVAERLRAAGAVILGKTNLSEWANFRSSHSTSGWSGRGGQTHNPYALDRNPCGSSSGSGAGVSANLCAVAIGTETDGSIVCPSNANGVVGIKPTVGLVGRSGIVPISHTQDTAGPMARTVADAAILLGALTGVDPRDRVTEESRGKSLGDYTRSLDAGGLRGARLGIARNFFGFSDPVDRLMDACIEAMKREGAVIVDPANLEKMNELDGPELEVLLYEFKADLNAYLSGRGPESPVHSLADLIAFNEKNRDREMPYFGQDLFEKAEAKGPLTDKAYRKALKKCRERSRKKGIDALVHEHRLDAIVAPTGGPCWTTDLVNGDHFSGGSSTPSAVAGYPDITVPAGYIEGLPVGISFFGPAYSEPVLIKIAYAFERATHFRTPPRFLRTADLR